MTIKRSLWVLMFLFLGSCGSSPPTDYYRLQPISGAATADPADAKMLGIGPLQMPGYLDRPKKGARDEHFRTRPVSAMRKGKWKLHLYHEEWLLDGGKDKIATNNAVELYNLEKDIGEKTNLAQQKPEVRDELINELLAWFEAVNAPMPTKRKSAKKQ